MPIFQASATVLTPNEDGDLTDVTGFVRALPLADGTAVIHADAVVGGTQLRKISDLSDAEKPPAARRAEWANLDQVDVNITQAGRTLAREYRREDGTYPDAVQNILDDFQAARQKVRARQDQIDANFQWPSDSWVRVLIDNGEDPQKFRRYLERA